MASRPLLGLSSALALGALVGGEVTRPFAWLLAGLAAALLVLAVVATLPGAARAALLGSAVAIGAAGAGAERSAYGAAPLASWVKQGSEEPVRLRGIAAADAGEAGERWVILLDVETVRSRGREHRLAGRVRLEVGGAAPRPEVGLGDRVAVWALLRPPKAFGTPGALDAAAHARREGVHALGYCKSPRLVDVEGRAPVGWIPEAAGRIRRWARGRLRRLVLPGPEQGLVQAMVLGDRSDLDPETSEAFRAAGTYHILAISGAQVALLAGILLATLRRCRLPSLAITFLVSGTLAFYAELVGGEAPVTRATTMAVVMLLGRWLDLDSDLANLLGLAGGLLLLDRPSAIADVGFQLSFVATLGILLLTPPVVRRIPKLPLRLDLALAASLAAQAAIAPLLALHFHRLTPAALLLNLVAVPLSAAVLIAGLGVLAAACVAPPLAPILGDLTWVAAHGLLRSGDAVRLMPGLDLRVPSPSLFSVALYLVGLGALLAGRRARALLLAGVGLAGLVKGRDPAPGDGRLQLTVLDVGQGDCLVVRSPRGRVWLVDAGGARDERFDVGQGVVGPYLWSEGHRRIEGLVLTHAHPDHVGGVPFLLRGFAVREVWEGFAPRRDPTYARLDRALREAGSLRRAVVRGVVGDWDGVRVAVLGPRRGIRDPWTTRNDDSVVLSLHWGRVGFLLTGDIEHRGEEALGGVACDVLKVPHHGSRTSSGTGFVSATAARVAVVSVGPRNPFGHPHGEVLDRYLRAGCRLFRTDRDGAVTVSTDGERIWVRTHDSAAEERVR